MMETRKKSKKLAALTVFLLICVGLYIFISVIPGISGALTRTAVISYGTLQVTDTTTCFLVRDEVVIQAKQSGTISYYIEEGSKTRKGTKVLDIYPAGGTASGYHCSTTGIVSYYVDGYEAYFTPDNIKNMEPAKLSELVVSPEDTVRTRVSTGEPVYKLILQDVWYAVILVSEENIGKYTVDSEVSVQFPDGAVKGRTTELIQKTEGWLVVVKIDRYYEGFARIRQAQAKVITKDYQGLILPNTAITQKEGYPGVYVRKLDGSFVFTRVKAITTDGNDSLVESSYFYETDAQGAQVKISTVEIYDEILRNADFGK
jgi:putative membrane fusion protein